MLYFHLFLHLLLADLQFRSHLIHFFPQVIQAFLEEFPLPHQFTSQVTALLHHLVYFLRSLDHLNFILLLIDCFLLSLDSNHLPANLPPLPHLKMKALLMLPLLPKPILPFLNFLFLD